MNFHMLYTKFPPVLHLAFAQVMHQYQHLYVTKSILHSDIIS